MNRSRAHVACVALLVSGSLSAQTPDEHAQHHPAPGGSGGTAAMEQPLAASAAEGMGAMMGMMGGQPPRQFYPALMALPDLPPEQRADIERLAHTRMTASAGEMTAAINEVAAAVKQQNFDRMQEATSRISTALG